MLSFTSWLRSLWVRYCQTFARASAAANAADAVIETTANLLADAAVASAPAIDEHVTAASPTCAQPVAQRLAVRIVSAKRINRVKRRSAARAVRRQGVGQKAFKKRAPDLYPMKRRKPVARKPKLKVLAARAPARLAQRPSAVIIQLPIGGRSNGFKNRSKKAA